MEVIYALLGFNLASTLFTFIEVVRLENAINQVFNTLSVVDEEEEVQQRAKTFM
jgi:PII-like signaling protein